MDGKPWSVPNYSSVRLYSTGNTQVNDDAGIFTSGLVRLRNGTLEKVFLENLELGEAPSLIVTMRSVGTGSYVSADAFKIVGNKLALHASITEISPDADPVVALKAVLKTSRKK